MERETDKVVKERQDSEILKDHEIRQERLRKGPPNNTSAVEETSIPDTPPPTQKRTPRRRKPAAKKTAEKKTPTKK